MYAKGDLRAACTALESALQLSPTYADAHCDLGCVRCALGQVEESKLSFADAVRHNPEHVEVSPSSWFRCKLLINSLRQSYRVQCQAKS